MEDRGNENAAAIDISKHVADDHEQMMVTKALMSLMLRDKRMCYACLDAVMDALAQMKKETGDKFDLEEVFDDMKSEVCRRIVMGDGVRVVMGDGVRVEDGPEKDDNAGGKPVVS